MPGGASRRQQPVMRIRHDEGRRHRMRPTPEFFEFTKSRIATATPNHPICAWIRPTVRRGTEQVAVRRVGKRRRWLDGFHLAVRALYLDLHTCSVPEPERWARWAALRPIRDSELRQFHIRRLSERMANRTRER